ENCWTDHFYAPQVAVQEMFLQQHAGDPTAEMLVRGQRREKLLYDKYKEYYGYVFYIGKKI
ncbi:MAG: SAM-dependent methyltransferase, partial [Petrimonas mucosa]